MKVLFNLFVAAIALGVYFVWGLRASGILLLLQVAAYVAFYVVHRRSSSRLTEKLLQMTVAEREAAIPLLDEDIQEEIRTNMRENNIP